MQTSRKIMKMLGSYLPVKAMVVAVASLVLFPLMVSAATVEVWQGDNFFTNIINGKPQESDDISTVNVTTIEVGDTVKWTNFGTVEHTTVSDDDFANGIFQGDLWASPNMAVGAIFSHTFDDEGEFLYLCIVHGRDDMAGKIVVKKGGGGNDDDPPTDNKSFTFECDRPFVDWIAGLELLELELGEEAGCTLTLTDPREGVTVKVLNRKIFRNSVNVNPSFCETDENGQCEFTIEAVSKGINWTAWGVPRKSDGEIVFNKGAYDNGTSWGSAIMVKGNK
ncbi:MAG: cupredoxin domain-containing protein [Candidatus Anammoxibacter sp.]